MTKLRLYSNSSLSDYRACPRLFFYKYIMEWMPKTRGIPLIFGGAWHKAMDAVWPGLIAQLPIADIAAAGYAAFLDEWVAGGMPANLSLAEEEELAPRTPMQAYEMLVGYVESRLKQVDKWELLDVEKPFAVPLDPDDESLFYVGKIDKIIRRRSRIIGLEHKTTTEYKKNGPFRATFLENFSPNSQVDGYLFALHMFYPGEVGGVWIDGALVHKNEEGFVFIPVEKQVQQLDLWLWETRNWIDSIEANIARSEESGSQDRYMPAFPKRTENCVSFGGVCAFLDFCRATANPLGRPLPPGFTKEPWDPLKHINQGREALFKEEK